MTLRTRHAGRAATSALLVLILTLVACKKKKQQAAVRKPVAEFVPTAYSVSSYARLCSGSAKKMKGTAYTKKTDPQQHSPVVVFQQYVNDKRPRYVETKRDGMAGWSLGKLPASKVELVACVEIKKKAKAPGQCSYYGGKIEFWEMTHTVRVLEALTGKELLKEDFDLTSYAARCPSTSKKGTVYKGQDFGTRLATILATLQPAGSKSYDTDKPTPKASDLDAVCDGVPFPQTAPYVKGSKGEIRIAYRPSDQYSYFMEVPFDRRSAPTIGTKDHQLVACVTGKPKKKKRDCKFMRKTMQLWDGEVEVVMRESATAKIVETKTFQASAGRCPTIHKFWTDNEVYFGKLDPAFFKYLDGFDGGAGE